MSEGGKEREGGGERERGREGNMMEKERGRRIGREGVREIYMREKKREGG